MSHSPTSDKNGAPDDYSTGWQATLDRVNAGGSWSGHERNCCFLNTGKKRFANVSSVTGLDYADDSRSVCPVDWDLDGDLDLWMSARTGPRLRFVRNDASDAVDPKPHFVALRLAGTTCNRDAIGAQVHLSVGGTKLIRALRAGDGYLSQGSKWVHFGLGEHDKIESVSVRWPGGDSEAFTDVVADARFVLKQGAGKAEAWDAPKREVSLVASHLETRVDTSPPRLTLHDRIPLPTLDYLDREGKPQRFPAVKSTATLITLWAEWCAPCRKELTEIAKREAELRAANVSVLALSVDGATKENVDIASVTQMLDEVKFPFDGGVANAKLLDKLDAVQEILISLRTQPDAIPVSFLVDEYGRLATIYPGPVTVDQVLVDAASLESPSTTTGQALPFAGRWFAQPHQAGKVLLGLVEELHVRKHTDDALRYAGLAADLATRDAISSDASTLLARIFFDAGNDAFRKDDVADAVRYYESCVRLNSGWAQAHTNLGVAYRSQGDIQRAGEHLVVALRIEPELLQANLTMGIVCLEQKQPESAVVFLRKVVQQQPELSSARNYLGVALARMGDSRSAIAEFNDAARLGNADAENNLRKLRAGETP